MSSSLKATYGVVTSSTAMLRATAPRFSAGRNRWTPGNSRATMSAVPSAVPLSATKIGAASGMDVMCADVSRTCERRLQVMITTEVRAMRRSFPASEAVASTNATLVRNAVHLAGLVARTAVPGQVATPFE